jgi:predicted DNA-binding transcriptional regulator AlpA
MSITDQDHQGSMEQLLTADDVARWLGVKPSWVRAHANGARRPMIPSIKVGNFLRFRRQDIETWLKQLSQKVA